MSETPTFDEILERVNEEIDDTVEIFEEAPDFEKSPTLDEVQDTTDA